MNDFDIFYKGMGIGLTDPDVLSYNSNTNLVDIFTMAGDTIILNVNPYLYNHNTKCKVVGGTDALLLNFAIRSGAKLFATFDNGFRGLTHPSIQALIIQDVYTI